MTAILEVAPDEIRPRREAALEQMGIPRGATVPPHVERLYESAAEIFAETVAPAGVWNEIAVEAFAAVYRGEGRNAPDSPVLEIFPKAERLALFAVTIGGATSAALQRCFEAQDFALAYTLDAIASVAADDAADLTERRYAAALRADGWDTPDGDVLRYSPGYCGWDVTGQRRLFAYLQPEAIGLTLTESCLMQPLKSVSGVMIAGPRAIHRFRPTYPFCDRCETRTCRERLRTLFARREPVPYPERRHDRAG
jgi:hypothetical protein